MPKLSKVRVRKRGQTFSYIFEAGKKEDGKRKVVEKGGFLTRKDAYEAGAVAFADWKHGNIGITSDRILVKDFFAQWLENVAKINVRQSTYDLYSRTINQRILPYLGSTDIQKITPALLDGFMRSLVKKGLARNTILSTWRILHQALDYAVYPAELIQSNASNYIKVPKSAPRDLVKRTIISPQKYSELMSLYPFGSPLHVPIALLYHTGMRIGEVLGVCWEDVDFRQNVIQRLTGGETLLEFLCLCFQLLIAHLNHLRPECFDLLHYGPQKLYFPLAVSSENLFKYFHLLVSSCVEFA